MANSILSNNPTQLLTKAKVNVSDWVDAGALEIGATTTAPTKGTSSVDKVRYRRIGENAEIEVTFHHTGVGGSAGSGDYLFSLPNGLQFSQDIVFDTSSTAFGDSARFGSFEVLSSSGATTTIAKAVPYDSTRFRLLTTAANTDVGAASNATLNFVGSGFFPITNLQASYKGTMSVPIQGWSSEAEFLAPLVQPKTAFIKDVKPSGTEGGTASSGGWIARELNNVSGDSDFLSLSSNVITLKPGSYDIECDSIFNATVNDAQTRFRNTTDSITELVSLSRRAGTGDDNINSRLIGRVEITEEKTFELQYQVQTTRLSDGLGPPMGFGENELFTQLKITKLL